MKKSRIWLSPPHMGGNEQKYIQEAFDTNWIAPLGANVDGFENDLSRYLNIRHVAALSSGTSAIHLALILLGIKHGDEVICSSFTFAASANPIVYQNATPVFVDSEKDTWNMDPELLEIAIKERIKKGKKPKAIILVHLYGMPAKIDEIFKITAYYNIPVIEDAAEALGSRYKGELIGTRGIMGILSFNGNKIITTSGGGALVSNNQNFIEKARFLATQASDVAPHYQHSQVGYNYRMSNIVAGIGRGQMEILKTRIKQKRAIHNQYMKLLQGFDKIKFLHEPNNFFSNRWLSTIIIEPIKNGTDREKIRISLENTNIEARPLWKPMHIQPVFKNYPAYVNGVSEQLFKYGLCLPSGTNMTKEDIFRVVEVLKRLLN